MKKISVGITGADGFVGFHLVQRLKREETIEAVPFPRSCFDETDQLNGLVKDCDAIVHLAAMNRGDDQTLYDTNIALVEKLIRSMKETDATPHFIFASSIQNTQDNPYGRSKRRGEEILEEWANESGAPLTILIIPNVYGERCKPFYNSVVATFCHQLTHGQEPQIIVDAEVELIYINNLVEEIYSVLLTSPGGVKRLRIEGSEKIRVSRVLEILNEFKKEYKENGIIPDISTPLRNNLFNVFLSYMEYGHYSLSPTVHEDNRGFLFEIVKLANGGQIFYSETKPGVVRGNHYHTRKIERFCVIKGEAVIRLRRIGQNDIIEYHISANKPEFIEIPIFHTHNIENIGDEDLCTLFWSNEVFNPTDTDTFFEEV
jgi:UDP-2-acetamido-2,6-beta-L-arabino-hexul-4-ose reductase